MAADPCYPAWSQAAGAPDANPPPPDFKVVGDQAIDERGFTFWLIDSPWKEGPNPVEVLCPDKTKTEKGTRFPVIYFLQVGPDFGACGNPMIEAKKLDLHNKYGVIFVLPAFKKVKREEAAGLGMRIAGFNPVFAFFSCWCVSPSAPDLFLFPDAGTDTI